MINHNNHRIEDSNIIGYTPLMSPYQLKREIPLTDKAKETIEQNRRAIRGILRGEEKKLLGVGPCSIHDAGAAKEYAKELSGVAEAVKDVFVIVMRMYFEKPRTTIGWKGLIYEPSLDGNESINEGLSTARQLLKYNAELGLPSGTEFLDTFVPQYIGDLISWGAIGARTVESQLHRQMASGVSMPIGFKNSTAGNIGVAINAVLSARQSHCFFGLDQYGVPSVVTTRGNLYTHIILRGGDSGANYDSCSVRKAQVALSESGLDNRLMIDCSHGNSNKDYRLQPVIFEDAIKQMVDGNAGIIGLMLESNINDGNQKIPEDPKELKYGVSITDPCVGWETTKKLIMDAYRMLLRSKKDG